jgi:hypothetical protein
MVAAGCRDGNEQWVNPGESVVVEPFVEPSGATAVTATIAEDFTAIRDKLNSL